MSEKGERIGVDDGVTMGGMIETSKAPLANATNIIVVHNHPTGDAKPSSEDVDLTKRLVEAGHLMGIDVLDHVIIGQGYYSLKEHGEC